MDAEAQTICGESTCVALTVETARRAPAKGLTRLSTFLRGKEILILGPGSVGKTKFAQYLRLGALDPEGKREMTYAVTRSPAFVLGLGQEEGVVLKVRRTVDTPGQVGPLQHALLVARRRPHAVVVMLDCSADPLSTLRWFCLFCDALDAVLRRASYVARRLQEMVVILNKRDKISDKDFAKLRQAVGRALERFLLVVWGEERVHAIPILECISIQTGRGTALIDEVTAQLIERLVGRQGQPDAAAGTRLTVLSPTDSGSRPPGTSTKPAAAGSSSPAGRQGQRDAAAGPGTGPRSGPPSPPYKPPLTGRQDQRGAAAGPKPAAVPPAGPRSGPLGPLYRPPLTGRQDRPSAAVNPKPVDVSFAGPRPDPSRPSPKPTVIPLRPPGK